MLRRLRAQQLGVREVNARARAIATDKATAPVAKMIDEWHEIDLSAVATNKNTAAAAAMTLEELAQRASTCAAQLRQLHDPRRMTTVTVIAIELVVEGTKPDRRHVSDDVDNVLDNGQIQDAVHERAADEGRAYTIVSAYVAGVEERRWPKRDPETT